MRTPSKWLVILGLSVVTLTGAVNASAALSSDQTRCLTTIAAEGLRFVNAKLAALRDCKDAERAASGSCSAPDPATLAAIDERLVDQLGRRCALAPADLVGLGFPGLCWDANPADGFTVDDLTACMLGAHQTAVEAVLPLIYDPNTTGTLPFADLHCQTHVAKRAASFTTTVLRAVQKCRTAVHRGTLQGIAPERCTTDHPPTAKKIAQAARKLQHHVDGRCTNDQAMHLGLCNPDAATAEGAAECLADAILQILADPEGCDLSDVEDGGRPSVACGSCPVPPPSEAGLCPTSVELTADGASADLDVGFTGLLHNQSLPGSARLTLAVSGCAGASQPGCGQCDLAGPIANAGDAAFDNHRCRDAFWIACTTDDDCTNAGATGPCTYVLGAPLPFSGGGVPSCVINEIDGAVIGTIDVDGGSLATNLPVTARVHVGGSIEAPCPRCVGGACDGGPRAGAACTVHGTGLFGDVSLDCPPSPSADAGDVPLQLATSTGTQTVTVTTANPLCRGIAQGKRCLCDTCNDAAAEPCMTNADCPMSGGNPGVCGGKRCLDGSNAGAPCSTGSDCPPASHCGRPGEPTRPNACEYDDSLTPSDGTLCVDTAPVGDGEGECSQLPSDSMCSIETFRFCLGDFDCTPGPSCPNCLPGQTCLVNARQRACFLNNGLLGGSDSVTGVADATCGSAAHPTVGAFFCVPPVGSIPMNFATGLPGLGRVRVPLTAVLRP